MGSGLGGGGHEGHSLVVRERGRHDAKQDDEELECGAPARVDGDALLVELEHGLDAQLDVPGRGRGRGRGRGKGRGMGRGRGRVGVRVGVRVRVRVRARA